MKRRIVGFAFALALVSTIFAQAAGLTGTITSVSPESKNVTLNIGSGGGVAAGMVFYILNAENYKVGTATILEAAESSSTAIYNMIDEEQVRPHEGMTLVYSEDKEAVSLVRSDVSATIPIDTEIVLEVVDRIGSQISNTGDVFKLRVLEPVVIDGVEVVAKGAEALGEVTYAKAAKGWGKSGGLNIEIKYVKAVDGSNILVSFEMEQSKKDNYAKAAIGGYVTGFIGGGAMKGSKIWIDPGKTFVVYVKRNTNLSFVEQGGDIVKGAFVKSDAAGSKSYDRKILFLGLQDSFSAEGSEADMVLTSKLSSFISYYLQWSTKYKFVKRHRVIEKTGYDLDAYFMKKGENVPVEQRYNIPEIKKIGEEMGADFVMCGDVVKYALTSKKKRNWLKTAAALSGGGVNTLDGQVKQQYSFDIAIDLMIYDVKKGEVVWNSVYKDFHQVSMPLGALNSLGIGNAQPDYKGHIGNTHMNVYKTEGYRLSRTDDPISFSVTDEGYTVIRLISPLVIEMESIL